MDVCRPLSFAAADAASWVHGSGNASLRDVVLRHDALPPELEGAVARRPAVRKACIQALLFEGLAADEAHGRAMLPIGAVELRPEQDHGVMTSLAEIVSAIVPMAAVGYACHVALAPLVEAPPRPSALARNSRRPACVSLRSPTSACSGSVHCCERSTKIGINATGRRLPWATSAMHASARPTRRWSRSSRPCCRRPAALQSNPGIVLTVLIAVACSRLRRAAHSLAAFCGNAFDFRLRMLGGIDGTDARPRR